jgi:hypothetical protein
MGYSLLGEICLAKIEFLSRAQQAEPLQQNFLMADPAKLYLPLENRIIYDGRTEEKPGIGIPKKFFD